MSGQKNEPDAIWTMLFIVAVVALGCAIFWHVFRIPMLEGLRWVRLGELWTVGLFTHHEDKCIQWLMHAKTSGPDTSPAMIGLTYDCFGSSFMAGLPSADKADFYALTGVSMGLIEQEATAYIRWPIAIGFIGVGIYVVFFSPRAKFRTKHNLESFIKFQAKMWPVISPIVGFNPIKSSARVPGDMIPDKLPLFAEALSPEEWISFHRIPVTNGVVDREAARRALLLQLGPRWNGIDDQAPYLRALFAAYALKGGQKREESDEFLGQISLCWTATGGFVLSPPVAAEIKKIFADPKLMDKAVEVAKEHAYRSTAMLGVLRWARSMGGVLAPAQFLWLRGVDRNLWYALNNLGRRSFHSEGMGAMAHFMAEQAAKKPLPIPRVDTAIITLNQFLSDPEKRSIPIPPREGDATKTGF
jgi:intracellular multiplication protein IcmP